MPPLPERRIRVDLGPRGYDVMVGAGLLARLGDLATASGATRPGSRVFVVCDDGLPAAAREAAESGLKRAGLQPAFVTAHASESEKSLAAAERILAQMALQRLDRLEPVIALGGGIIGDLAGFVAATYRRGVPFVQCPTTLLAMVDASVGGKTGVNLDLGRGDLKKNMIGVFHQPRAVVADVSVLGSLPERTFRAGLAECIKHGMIAAEFGDPGLFDWTSQSLGQILNRDPGTLTELISRNVAVKAAVVGRDEREEDQSGGRALLNLGHTFAHAIEPLPNLRLLGAPISLQHGEAVALGLVAAARCATAAGLCTPRLDDSVRAALAASGLPTSVGGLPPTDEILDLMAHDKKVLSGRLRLVLPRSPGRSTVVADPPRAPIEAGLNAIRA